MEREGKKTELLCSRESPRNEEVPIWYFKVDNLNSPPSFEKSAIWDINNESLKGLWKIYLMLKASLVEMLLFLAMKKMKDSWVWLLTLPGLSNIFDKDLRL